MPKISVIVPIYKVEKYLHRCVDSIIMQTFKDFELILVDDGSPDNCGVICEQYAERDERVVVIHQNNCGLSAARNAGIDWVFTNSESNWICFIDSDDWVHPKYLEVLFNAVHETGLDIAICGFEKTAEETPQVDETSMIPQIKDTEEFYCEQTVVSTVAWNKLYKKEAFKFIRYPVGKIHEDEFTTYKILFQYKKLAVVEQPLYAYFQNQSGIMGKKWSPDRLQILDALDERIRWLKKRNDFSDAVRLTVQIRFCMTREILDIIDNNVLEYGNKLQKKVRRNMGDFLRAHPKEFPFEQYKWYYELAYPFEMRIYWIVKSRIRKRH